MTRAMRTRRRIALAAKRGIDVLGAGAGLVLLAPLLALCIVLVGLGSYLVMRAIVRIQGFDRKIRAIEGSDVIVRDLLNID